MNILVVFFFVFNVIATFILGAKFVKQGDSQVFKVFGKALLLNALAFAIWSFGVVQPESLLISVTIGSIIFLISLVFMFDASVLKVQMVISRRLLIMLGIFIVLGIFAIGHADPSYAFISSEGFLFFNLGPLVQMLYVFVFALASLPAFEIVASKFKNPYATIFRYGFIAQFCSGVMLMTTKDAQVIYATGWVIILVYLMLLITFLFNKKAWSDIN